jgi:membrane protease subunit HflK
MRYVGAAVLLVLFGWLLTGVTQVRPGERAVVRRFGRILPDKPGPGLYLGLPWGLEQVDRVAVDRVRRVVVGYEAQGEEDSSQATPAGQLLTGDHNLINLQVEVNYTIVAEEAERFVVQADRVDALIGRAAETLLAEWVAGRKVEDVLLRGKEQLPGWLTAQTQARIAPYQLGVRIENASVNHLYPPPEVKKEFDEVTRVQTAIRTRINESEEKANSSLRDAEAEAFRLVSQAAAYANEQKLLARAEAENFEKRLAQYRQLRRQDPNHLNHVWWDAISRLYARMRANGRIDLLDRHLAGEGLDITQFPALPKKKN